MTIIVAALDSTAAARPVLETALRMGELTGADVEVVHVSERSIETPRALALRNGLPFRLLEGPPEGALVEAVGEPNVTAAVLGARATAGGRRPVGRRAMHVLQSATKPVVIVPPEALSPAPLRRILVPLEGVESHSQSVVNSLSPLLASEIEVVVLHVFTDETIPRMLNHGHRDLELLGEEFLKHHLPNAKSIEFRTGPVCPRVIEVSAEQGVDLVVLNWSQVTSGGRARVVQEILGASLIPVLLLPLAPVRTEGSQGTTIADERRQHRRPSSDREPMTA